MPEEEKDKYDELEKLSDAEEIEAELEELPVEAVPEPLGERTEPMDDLLKEGEAQPDAEAAPAPEGTSTDLGKKIEAAAKVRDASEYLRGHKQVRVIKKSAIKSIVDSIIGEYSGMEHKDLLSKIAEYEFNLSNLRQERDRLAKDQQAVLDEAAIKYEKEIEELKTRLATAEELLSQETDKEKLAKLEEEVVYLRQRVKELEGGLEFATVVEEYDYGLAIESAVEQKQKIADLSQVIDKLLEAEPEKQGPKTLKELFTAISDRYDFLVELLKESQHSYADLFKKVAEIEGSVGVVAELIRLNARNRGWSKELAVCRQFLETAEATARGK